MLIPLPSGCPDSFSVPCREPVPWWEENYNKGVRGCEDVKAASVVARAAAASLAIFLANPLAAAMIEEEIASVDMPTGGIVAWKANLLAGSQTTLKGTVDSHGSLYRTVALWILDPEGEPIRSSSVTYIGYHSTLHASAPPPIGDVTIVYTGENLGRDSWSLSVSSPTGGIFTFVALVAGNGEVSGSAELLSTPETTLLSEAFSDEAFLRPVWEFAGETNIVVKSVLSVRVIENATAPFASQDAFFGSFVGGTNTGMLEMEVAGPNGILAGDHHYVLSGQVAGIYSFRIVANIDSTRLCLENLDSTVPLCGFFPIWAFGGSVRLKD